MINIDKKNGIYEYDDNIDMLWEEIEEFFIFLLALSEYIEGKDYVKTHIEKIRMEYKESRKDLIENLIDKSAQEEKNEKLPDFNEAEINDLLHI